MSLPVDLILMENFIRVRDVVAHGVGPVERNIVAPITILRQVNVTRMRRTITTLFVVKKKQDSNKKSIVLEDIVGIVGSVGTRRKSFYPSE
jgi:hypothetical protein